VAIPTKADPLYERMVHAFGETRIRVALDDMLSIRRRNMIDCLTDEAREELLDRCIRSHKLSRKFSAESRRLYRKSA